jgi:nucleotide-binding universal stress UspA family protein
VLSQYATAAIPTALRERRVAPGGARAAQACNSGASYAYPELSDPPELGYRPVIIGMDGSRDAIAGLERGSALAEAMKIPLIVVHVRHPSTLVEMSSAGVAETPGMLDELERDARQKTEKLLADRQLSWSFEVREGAPAHELIAAAREHDAGAIIVGSRGHNAVASAVLGSVSSALVHRAPQSVVVVRPALQDSPDPS